MRFHLGSSYIWNHTWFEKPVDRYTLLCFETGSLLLGLVLTHNSPIHASSLLTYTTHVHRDAFSSHTATYTQATALPTLGTMFGKGSMTFCDNFPPKFWVIMQIYPIKEKTKGKRDLKNTPDLTDPPQAFSVSVYYVSCLLHKSIAHFNLLGLLWAPLCACLTMSPYRHTMRISLSLGGGEKSNLELWTQSARILFREKYLPLCRIFFHYFGRVSWPCLKLYNTCSLFLQWLCSISIIKICYHGALL